MPIDLKLECYLNMNIHHHTTELLNYFSWNIEVVVLLFETTTLTIVSKMK